jgi:hypothetical protein
LHFFSQVLEHDHREAFPENLLSKLHWNKCIKCGLEHSRSICPACAAPAIGVVRATIEVRGTVTATQIFTTNGLILCAASQNGHLKWLYHNNGKFMRENNKPISAGPLLPKVRYRIWDNTTLFGTTNSIVGVDLTGKPIENLAVDNYGTLPMFDANAEHLFWLQDGRLLRQDKLAPRAIRNVIENRTLFWVGSKFGFGLARAGEIKLVFTFDANNGLSESLDLPLPPGQLVDTTCILSGEAAWFFATIKTGSELINHCLVFDSLGHLQGKTSTTANDGSWLGEIRGKCAVGSRKLLAPTDEGIVQIVCENQQIGISKTFPDSKPFVDSHSQLFVVNEGLAVVGQHSISILKLG